MSVDYTDWPKINDVREIASAMNQTFGASITTSVIDVVRQSVIDTIEKRTQRTWIPVTETRYFNGNGTGLIEVDEFISISEIKISGWTGANTGLTLTDYHIVNQIGFPQTKIQIYRGSIPTFGRQWVTTFPHGRSNVEITAEWGYGETIPADLWLCAAYRMTGILLNFKAYQEAGYLIKFQEADVTEVRNRMDPFEYFQHGISFKSIMKLYKKPTAAKIRLQQKELI